jgi:hypothetical protein
MWARYGPPQHAGTAPCFRGTAYTVLTFLLMRQCNSKTAPKVHLNELFSFKKTRGRRRALRTLDPNLGNVVPPIP